MEQAEPPRSMFTGPSTRASRNQSSPIAALVVRRAHPPGSDRDACVNTSSPGTVAPRRLTSPRTAPAWR